MDSVVETIWPRQGSWQSFGLSHGLPDMKVEGLGIDSGGGVWVGTHDKGAAHYDGAGFMSMSRAEGLPGHGVYSIIPQSDGSVLLATDDGIASYQDGTLACCEGDRVSVLWGSCVFDGRSFFGLDRREGAAPRIAVSSSSSEIEIVELDSQANAVGMSITAMTADPEGRLWCGGRALYTWDGGTARCEVAPEDMGQVRAMCFRDDLGEVWGASDTGLFRCRPGQFDYFDGPQSIQGMVVDGDGTLWATGQDGNLYRGTEVGFEVVSSAGVPLWRGVGVDGEGRIWVGSYGFGLLCYDATRVMVPVVAPGMQSFRTNAVVALDQELWASAGSDTVHSPDVGLRGGPHPLDSRAAMLGWTP
jgi:ligand-binding sensor domain-containing protein